MPCKLKITQVKSLSGRIQKHIRTIEALGLRRIEIDHVCDEVIKVNRGRVQFRFADVAEEIVKDLL